LRVFLAAPAAIRLAPDIRGASLSSSGLLAGDPAAVEAERDLASMWTRATGWPEKSWAARMTRSAAPQSGFGRRPYRSRRLRRHRGGEGEDRLADGGVPPELVRLDGSGSEVALEQGVAERLVGKLAAGLDQGAEAFAVIDQSAEARGRA
jgi:hypothetical protein